jgi:ribosomal protein S18 acetylase RimI-like enzyme
MTSPSAGERDLQRLLAGLSPRVAAEPYVFVAVDDGRVPAGVEPFATVREDEGLTLVLPKRQADRAGLAYDFVAVGITLQVHSDLAAVGLTAAVATRLAEAGISCNVVAGFHHDHLLVPRERAEEAVAELERLATEAATSPRPVAPVSTADLSAAGLLPGWSVRHPRADDHARVQAVLGQWWGDFGGEAGARERAALLPRLFFEHFTDTSYLIEDGDRRLVAFLIGFLSPSRPGTAYVHFVGVDPATQRAGLGRWLYARFSAAATARGAREVRCITSPGNRNSIAFHSWLGFRIEPGDRTLDGIRVHGDHDGPGLHRVIFTRPVDDRGPT